MAHHDLVMLWAGSIPAILYPISCLKLTNKARINMHTKDAIQIFSQLIRQAILASGTNEIKAGNVEFWIEEDRLCYSIPTSKWDKKAIDEDITKLIAKNPLEMFIFTELMSRPPILNRNEVETLIRKAWRLAGLDAINNPVTIESLINEEQNGHDD